MPKKLIRKAVFAELHFDPDDDFLYKERDKVRAILHHHAIVMQKVGTCGVVVAL